jgi:hypothetical protein
MISLFYGIDFFISRTFGTHPTNHITLNALKGTSGNLIFPGEPFAGRIDEPCRRG